MLCPWKLAAAVLLAAAIPIAAAQPAKKVLRIHTAGPNDTNVDNTKLAVEFAENSNKASPTVDVKVFPASQLGQTREVIEAMRLGSGAAGTTGGPAEYASFVRRLGVLGLPFEWKSYEHALRVLDGPVGKELDQDMEKGGFKVLSWAVSWGFRNALTKHLMDPTFLVFSLAEWKKLSPAEQSALQKAATDAAKVVREMAPQREAEALAQVRKLGMKVNEIDTAPLVKAALTAQDELAKEFGAEKLLEQIRQTPG